MIGCLNEETLREYFDRELDPVIVGQVIKHLAECDWCADNAFEMERTLELMASAFDNELPANVPSERLRSRLHSALSGNAAVVQIDAPIERPSIPVTQVRGLTPAGFPVRRIAYAAAAAVILASALWFGVGSRLLQKEELQAIQRSEPPRSPDQIPKSTQPERAGDGPTARAQLSSRKKAVAGLPAGRGPEGRESGLRIASRPPAEKGDVTIAEVSSTDDSLIEGDLTTFNPGMIRYFERAQVLLRSFRNADPSAGTSGADLTRERRRSKSLLYENILLRREAETNGNLPAEEVLGRLEPILLDIANLPDEPSPHEVRLIKDRMHRQEIVAVLQVYSALPSAADYRQH